MLKQNPSLSVKECAVEFGISVPSVYRILRRRHTSQQKNSDTGKRHTKGAVLHSLCDALESLIDHTKQKGHSKLPTIRQLSRHFSVGMSTMQHAVAGLRDKGIITTIRGKGMFIASMYTSADKKQVYDTQHTIDSPMPAWQVVKLKILKDITSGIYQYNQSLPSLKQMGHTYGASFQTLKTALQSLQREIGLTPWKKTYFVPARHVEAGTTIVLLAPIIKNTDINHFDYFLETMLPLFDSLCSQKKISLEVVPLLKKPNVLLSKTESGLDSIVRNSTTLGFCVFSLICQEYPEVIHWLRPYGKPVVLFDNVGCFSLAPLLATLSSCKVFLHGCGRRAPEETAQYLLSLGHTRAAWFSLFSNTPWSKLRYDVLQEKFHKAGGVCQYVSLIPEHVVQETVRIIQLYTTNDMHQSSMHAVPMQLERKEREFLDSIDKAFSRFKHTVFSLFETTLQESGITAWIHENDFGAELAMTFLRARRIPVPQRISVVGFDNKPASFVNGISSYRWSLDKTISEMINYLINPETFSAFFGTDFFVEVGGRLIARKSSGPAKRHTGNE